MTTSMNERNTDNKGSYAEVHGLKMYYEIRGTGKPLVLIPGGMMTISMMGQILLSLAKTRQSSRSSCRRMGTRPTSIVR